MKPYKCLYTEFTNRQLFLFTTILDFFISFFFFFLAPVSVNSFQCEPVAKQPFLMLKWKCPSGNNSGFKIIIRKGAWEDEQLTPSCLKEGSEESITTASLDYYSTYNVTIVTVANTSESLPVWKMCNTSITGKH